MNTAEVLDKVEHTMEPTVNDFSRRHLGPSDRDVSEMLKLLGFASLDQFIDAVVPKSLRQKSSARLTDFSSALSETEALSRLRSYAAKNKLAISYIGAGYYDCIVPPVIQRNILENPGWYTQYTPYQAEIAQGRLEALLNFQTVVAELTGLEIANASLLDEGTAAAEAMAMTLSVSNRDASSDRVPIFLVADNVHRQTLEVLSTRAEPLGIQIKISPHDKFEFSGDVIGCLIQNPGTNGDLVDLTEVCEKAHANGALVTVAADLLALCLMKSPGEMGADIAVGSAQRFGVPMGFGGPHAAFFATRDQYKRSMPGRLVGVSKDSSGNRALRLALQTREQHIRREKATSNICTAQVLLAVMAGMYAVYHGPEGLKSIATSVGGMAGRFAAALRRKGIEVVNKNFFDTLTIKLTPDKCSEILKKAAEAEINLRKISDKEISLSFDEAKTESDLVKLASIFGIERDLSSGASGIPDKLKRSSKYLSHAVFNSYHTETEMLRYIRKLESRDLSLCTSMIPLGSCTMKLNATAEMFPVSWPEFSKIHPFSPRFQTVGYRKMFEELERALCEITGFDACSLQPNAGSQGEYAGLLVVRSFLKDSGETQRNICLIPRSAHGTNPASAAMAGLKVVPVACDEKGNIDLGDLKARAEEHAENLAVLMVTYPSTHGVFEEGIRSACEIVHKNGGQVYMDGANMNALVGLCQAADLGADVCHINLHKTFCIPHGGGGPGMGPICVAKHLASHLPNHGQSDLSHKKGIGAVSAAPWGSASILPIPWMYIAMMGADGLTEATKIAILNANYVSKRLSSAFPSLFTGANGLVAHECILDLRALKSDCGVEVEDVAKRLMDYGFHAPTVSWPVPGTVMVEPTESESKAELDRFCDAMIAIHAEAMQVKSGAMDKSNNPLKNAPHTAEVVTSDKWDRPYSRETAAFPAPWTKEHKFWPKVGRIDGTYGDRNLFCTCG